MKPLLLSRTAAAVTLALTCALALSACGSSESPTAAPQPDPVVHTPLGLPTPTGDPDLDHLRDQAPAAGTVGRLRGPFDSRFDAGPVSLDGQLLKGSITVTSDVSDIMALQVQAGFYDKAGTFLGSSRWDYVPPEESVHSGPPDENAHFAIDVPASFRDKVASANWGVTYLVNE